MDYLTPVERHGDYWMKRDDLYTVAGVRGGKARTAWLLAEGAPALVTAGSRMSPQVAIVSAIARELGVPCWCFVPAGPETPEITQARANGAVIMQVRPGHNSVIVARAREHARAQNARYIPFGMECEEAVMCTAEQVQNLPPTCRVVGSIVVPVGSGMTLAGILNGLSRFWPNRVYSVLAVRVGADPSKRLERWAPGLWRPANVEVEWVKSDLDYHHPAPQHSLEGVPLDPHYEAKCLPFLRPNDLLWVVGRRGAVADGQ